MSHKGGDTFYQDEEFFDLNEPSSEDDTPWRNDVRNRFAADIRSSKDAEWQISYDKYSDIEGTVKAPNG